jgi:hypothetical protein|tara:strand:- start:440 stop:667 length:228 start_codon:yes stop_codon:yes gene_type:complete
MARKTAQDVHLELCVLEAENQERWKTAFNKFEELDCDVKEIRTKLESGTRTIIGLLVVLLTSFITLIVRSLLFPV